MDISEIFDEIFGTNKQNHNVENSTTLSSENQDGENKPNLAMKLPIPTKNSLLKSITVTPKKDFMFLLENHKMIESPIVCDIINSELQIDWNRTIIEINNRLRDEIKTSKSKDIIDSILNIINKEKDNIDWYFYCVENNGPYDRISEYIESFDETDTTDTTDTTDINKTKILNVSDAIKLNNGYSKVKGSVRSISEPFKLIEAYTAECPCGNLTRKDHCEIPLFKEPKFNSSCKQYKGMLNVNYEYINAISVELQDDEKFNEIERLNCILLDTDVSNIKIGEKVEIRGHIHILSKNHKGNLIPVLFSRNNINYQNKNETVLNELDEQAIKRFANMYGESVISKLVDMYDKTVIGLDLAKKALLLSLVSSGDDYTNTKINIGTRNRLHCLLVGKPGVAKSSLLRKAASLISNSRYESSQHSSGKSLTAIVDKEDEHYCLRLGPIPLAKKSVCALNEIGTISFEEQKYLLDVMEEGGFTINKYGINSTISSPTTIVASTNLLNSSHDGDLANGNIHLNQIPCTAPVRDRFDLIVVVYEETDDLAILDYVDKKMDILSKRTPNYDLFLQKYIQYARNLESMLDPKCKNQVKYYYAAIKKSYPLLGSNRVLESIIRLCKSISKLKLKKVVDERDVTEAIEFYNHLISKYVDGSNVPTEPDKYAYEKCLNILKGRYIENTEVRFEDLLYEACEDDGIVKAYLLDSRANIIDRNKLKIDTNHKARQVRDLLINSQLVRIIKRKPLTLQIVFAMREQ